MSVAFSFFLFHCSFTMLKFTYSNTILFGGEDSQRATPVPIPNTEVKSLGADGTAGVAQWESRSSPPFLFFVSESHLYEILKQFGVNGSFFWFYK